MISTHKNLLERFHDFDDGLLQSIRITYEAGATKSLEVLLVARDWSDSQGSWATIRLQMHEVEHYRFVEPLNTTAQVLSNGIHIFNDATFVGLELGSLIDPPASLAELSSSDLFAIGLNLSMSVVS